LDALGITDTPSSYDSDSTVSYEVGSKNSLFDGALQIAASGFYIKWMDIQSSVPLAACGSEFVTNFGEATSKGFDLGFSVRPTSNLTFSGSAGYTNATLDKTLHGTGTIILGLKGDSVTSGPKWTATISGNYDFQIAGKDAFVRSDYQYQGKGQVRSPGVFGVDPGILPSEKVHALAFRAGIDIGHIEISAYVNNALDEAPRLSTSRDTPVSPLFYETTLRPRTFGITLTYR
jgi:outer membrane receptor protein involved in Fe transport